MFKYVTANNNYTNNQTYFLRWAPTALRIEAAEAAHMVLEAPGSSCSWGHWWIQDFVKGV